MLLIRGAIERATEWDFATIECALSIAPPNRNTAKFIADLNFKSFITRDVGRRWSYYQLYVVSKMGQKGEILRKSANKGEKVNFVSKSLIHKIWNFESRSKI